MLAYICPRDGRRTISGKVKGFETHELGSNERFDVDFYKIQVQNNDKFGEDGLIMRGARAYHIQVENHTTSWSNLQDCKISSIAEIPKLDPSVAIN